MIRIFKNYDLKRGCEISENRGPRFLGITIDEIHYIIALEDFISGNNNSPSFKRVYKMTEYDKDFLVAKGEERREKDLISKVVAAFEERLPPPMSRYRGLI